MVTKPFIINNDWCSCGYGSLWVASFVDTELGYLASNTWLNDVERQCCGCRNQSAKWSPIDFTTGFSGQWAEKEKKVWRLHGCSMPNMSEKANGQMVTIGWGWGQNSDQIRESLNRCLSLSRTYSQTESKKSCKPCSGEPSFRYTCVCLSQIHTTHYVFYYDIYIYIRTTCCLLCTFAQVHAEIEIICRCYDLQGIEYISFINYDQIKCHSLSMGPWLLIFFSFRKRMPATESQLDLKV